MDDGIPPASGPHRFEPPMQEGPRHRRANPVKPIKGKGHRQPSSATLKQRTAVSSADWHIQRHQELLTQKHSLSCQKVFADSLEEIRSIMENHARQSQHFRISYIDDSGKKIAVIPPEPALTADPERLQELMKELDLDLKPLERRLKPQRANIHKRLDDVEQALNISKTQLENQGLKIPRDPGTPDAFFLGKELLDIPEPALVYPKPRQPENQAHPQAKKAPQNTLSPSHGNQADNTRQPTRSNTPPPPPFQKDKGFEFSTRPAKWHRANDPDPARKHSKPPQNARTKTATEVEPDYEVKPPSKSRKPNPVVNDSQTNGGNFPPPPPAPPPPPPGWTKPTGNKGEAPPKQIEVTPEPARNSVQPGTKENKKPDNFLEELQQKLGQKKNKAENVREVTPPPHSSPQVKPKTFKPKENSDRRDTARAGQRPPYKTGTQPKERAGRGLLIPKDSSDRSDAEELEMTHQWLEFYQSGNSIIAGQHYTLDQILSFSDDDLEQKHDFIQQLFPIQTDTANNPKAPKMTPQMASEIKRSTPIQKNIDRALSTLLAFWGLDWNGDQQVTVNPGQYQTFITSPKKRDCSLDKWCHDEKTIQKAPPRLHSKLRALQHNELRITRLLHFLMDIGRPELAWNIQSTMNEFRQKNGAQIQTYWLAVWNGVPGKKANPVPAPPTVKPTVPPKPKVSHAPSAQPADRYEARGNNTTALYDSRNPFSQPATLERWQTPGGAGTAAWQIHSDPTFDPQHHKVGVVVAGNHGLPLGGLADSEGLKETVTPAKLKLKTQEETVTANCLLTTCGKDKSKQDQWVANTVLGRWGLKKPVYKSEDTMTIQGIDYTRSKNPEDYADAWVVRDTSLSAVAGQQLVPETKVKADLIFSAGPNANDHQDPKKSGHPTGSMKRTLNQASLGKDTFPHFRECVKCTVRAALDGAANANNTHVLLAPISCGVYAGKHKDKMTDKEFDAIVNEVLNEPVGPLGEGRRAYFVKVIVSGIRSDQGKHPVRSSQDYMTDVRYEHFRGKGPSTHVGFYHKEKPYYEFTNFWPTKRPLVIDGHAWRTTEHYFQACKFKPGSEEWNNIRNNSQVKLGGEIFDLQYPSHVFNYIRAVMKSKPQALQYTNNQWSNIKDQVMLKALRAKAQQSPRFRQLLSQSGQKPLFETSDKDDYWGTGKHHNGQNRLGALLMQVRDEFNAGLLPEAK